MSMKSALILLTAIVGTLPAIPARAIPVSFGYADKGFSLKGVKPFKPKQTSETSRSLKMKGIVALGDQLYPDAVNYFKQALAATDDPQEKADLKQYIYTTLKIGGGSSWNVTFPKQAIAMLTEAISMNPKYFWLYARRGDAYCNMGQLAPCLANHNIAIKLDPDKADAYSRLAITLVHIDPVRSVKAFDLSIKLYRLQGNLTMAKTMLATKSASGL
jgi:tetratricopeptide (TPR) repeat protein